MTTIVGPISASPGLPGGISAALNIAAAGVIKTQSGVIVRLLPQTVGTGTLVLYDANANVTAQTITGITAATQAVVTLSTGGASNPFGIGNTITFASVVGMTQINGLIGTVTAIGGVTTAWTVTVSINSSAFTAYASGGSATSFGASNLIETIPVAAFTAGLPYVLEWPCSQGIFIQTLPSGGLYSMSFS